MAMKLPLQILKQALTPGHLWPSFQVTASKYSYLPLALKINQTHASKILLGSVLHQLLFQTFNNEDKTGNENMK